MARSILIVAAVLGTALPVLAQESKLAQPFNLPDGDAKQTVLNGGPEASVHRQGNDERSDAGSYTGNSQQRD